MGRDRTKQTFKLRLLAFVLALALVWRSLNPAPISIARIRREDELPDEKKREAEPQPQGAAAWPLMLASSGTVLEDKPARDEVEDDFDWPDLIDA